VVAALSRFPVKSLLGEDPQSVEIDTSGIVGDRAWALVDVDTGKVASAKHPEMWAGLLALRATYADGAGARHPVRITLPDGDVVGSADADVHDRLSRAAGRAVRLIDAVPPKAVYDEEWPEGEQIAPQEFIASTRTGRSARGSAISSIPVAMLAPGTFQDLAPLTLMTTASLRAARTLHPDGDWDPRRFRSTILLDVPGDTFVEQEWVGRTLAIGDAEVTVTAPTPRCVMVTLAQQDLPEDGDVLRTLARHNRLDVLGTGTYACLGAYASVTKPGRISRGDEVTLA
jgi:uncharacterized protein YcbX